MRRFRKVPYNRPSTAKTMASTMNMNMIHCNDTHMRKDVANECADKTIYYLV